MSNHKEPTDIVLITALPIEQEAILSRLDSHEIAPDGTYYQGRILTKNNRQYSVIVSLMTDMGNMESGITATQLLERFKPKIMIMLGIAAGRLGKVQLGDVVVADHCDYYELAKLTATGEQIRLRQLHCHPQLYKSVRNYKEDDWHTQIHVHLPAQSASHRPQVHFGPIGSGEKVIADNDKLTSLLKHIPDLLAVAMEGAGVAKAVGHYNGIKFIEIRGICDYANPDKNDNWQLYAANAAGAFLMGWLKSGAVPLESSFSPSVPKAKDSPFPPLPKPDYFIGREELLSQLHQQLQENGTVLLVNGIGGIGKTALAQAYAWQYQNTYDWIAWVHIQSDLRQDLLMALEKPLQLVFPENSRVEERFAILLHVLQQSHGHHLLILDNVNDAKTLTDYRHDLKTSGWQVLITSRCTPDEYKTLAVEELPEATANTLFKHHYQLPVDDRELTALLEKIDYHTLLIELVAKSGRKKGASISQLSESLDRGIDDELLQRIITIGEHADNRQSAPKQAKLYEYILTLFEPTQLSELSLKILRYFSVLPSNDIPLPNLKSLFSVMEENAFEEELEQLYQSGWLQRQFAEGHYAYKMHALVRTVMFVKLAATVENCAELIAILSERMQDHLDVASKFQPYAQGGDGEIINRLYAISLVKFLFSGFL